MDKLLLVDGSNLLFQMFYGMPARIVNREGRTVHGTVGFVGALLKMLRMVNPTHTAVFFDGESHNPRRDLDPNYKADREDYSLLPEEETPFSQLPDICAALDYLKIGRAETVDCETDDWMAAYALSQGEDTALVLASMDSDYFQLVSSRVQILRYRGKNSVLLGPDEILEKTGTQPCNYAFFKALTGDTSDNLRGAPGVGPKTAAALVARFGGLEELLSRGEEIEKPALRAAVLENAERLRRNYSLINLTGDVPKPLEMPQMRYHDAGMTSTEVLRAIGVLP